MGSSPPSPVPQPKLGILKSSSIQPNDGIEISPSRPPIASAPTTINTPSVLSVSSPVPRRSSRSTKGSIKSSKFLDEAYLATVSGSDVSSTFLYQ